jgi:hypothetical protein
VSDIDTVVVDSLKALDPEWPIREADITSFFETGRPSSHTIGTLREHIDGGKNGAHLFERHCPG